MNKKATNGINPHIATYEKFIQGDESAFKEIFELHYHGLVFYARAFVEKSDVAEDIVQEQFIKLWQNRKKIRTAAYIKSYLYKSVYNSCLNHKKHMAVVHHSIEYNREQASKITEESTNFERLDFQNMIYNQINQLPLQCKKVFKLSRFFGLKHREIAKSLGISENTVKNHIVKALQILHDQVYKKK